MKCGGEWNANISHQNSTWSNFIDVSIKTNFSLSIFIPFTPTIETFCWHDEQIQFHIKSIPSILFDNTAWDSAQQCACCYFISFDPQLNCATLLLEVLLFACWSLLLSLLTYFLARYVRHICYFYCVSKCRGSNGCWVFFCYGSINCLLYPCYLYTIKLLIAMFLFSK